MIEFLSAEARLSHLVRLFCHRKVHQIAVFGSVARGESDPDDIDVILIAEDWHDAFDFAREFIDQVEDGDDAYFDDAGMRHDWVVSWLGLDCYSDDYHLVTGGSRRNEITAADELGDLDGIVAAFDAKKPLDIFVFPPDWETDTKFWELMRDPRISHDPMFMDNIFLEVRYLA